MPVICVNPVDKVDAKLLEKLSNQNQDIRLFVSEHISKETKKSFIGKIAIGDLKDDTHISTASSGAYCGIFFESEEAAQRSVFIEAIKNSRLQRVIWSSPYNPSEEITTMKNLVYIVCKDKHLAHDVILDFEGRAEVETEIIELIN